MGRPGFLTAADIKSDIGATRDKPDSDNRARAQFECHVGCRRTAAPSHDLTRMGTDKRPFHAGIQCTGPVDG
jgi:hypothetical protein